VNIVEEMIDKGDRRTAKAGNEENKKGGGHRPDMVSPCFQTSHRALQFLLSIF